MRLAIAPYTAAVAALRDRMLPWYALNKRDLPWRRTRDPYSLVAAELMLQQTGVERIAPKWQEFVARFPTWEALAAAPVADVIREWRGLGYNRRAVSLQSLAGVVVERHSGRLPADRAALLKLPGVGPYTASAILSFVHGQDVAAVDVNLRRVIGRVVFGVGDASLTDVEAAAAAALPAGRSGEWNQAIMDFASLVCTLRRPACGTCALRDVCAYARPADAEPALEATDVAPDGAVVNRPVSCARLTAERPEPYLASRRFLRGRIVDACRDLPPGGRLSTTTIATIATTSDAQQVDVEALLAGLVRDGLIARHEGDHGVAYSLP